MRVLRHFGKASKAALFGVCWENAFLTKLVETYGLGDVRGHFWGPSPAGQGALPPPLQLAPARWRLFDLPAGVQLEVRRCREGTQAPPP